MRSLPLLLLASLGFPVTAQDVGPQQGAASRVVAPSPFVPLADFATKGFEFANDAVLQEELGGASSILLSGVLTPTAAGTNELVELELERIDVVPAHAQLWVDGEWVGGEAELEQGFQAWGGRVAGEPDSDVFLAFGSSGSYGWIQRRDGTSHVLSVPEEDGSWSGASGVLVHGTDPLLADGGPGFTCSGPLVPPTGPHAPGQDQADHQGHGGVQKSTTTLEAFLAIETDYQFYELFDDITATQDYALALIAAMSLRFEASANTKTSVVYLGLYSDANDPWSEADNGGGAGDVLGEFQSAWQNNIPNGAHLGHYISGASLGGGVAYVDVLCNSTFGFAVSGDLHGQMPFPVSTSGPLNWDFFVVSHETGHNFGSPHTHDYCPPLDECSPGFGACQTQQTCITTGTIMSYCHLCPGGMNNIQTNFHPTVAGVIAAEAAACFGPCQTCDPLIWADFTATQTSGLPPLTVDFTDLSSGLGGIDTWAWYFGDGGASSLQNPSYTYTTPGTYGVTLISSGPNGGDLELKTNYVTIDTPPDPVTITSVTPYVIDNLIPGTDETITILGTGFTSDTVVQLDFVTISTSFTVVDDQTITFDMPPAANRAYFLGVSNVNGLDADIIFVQPPANPTLQASSGDPGAAVLTGAGIPVTFAGSPGAIHDLVASASNVPSVLPGKIDLDLGNFFTQFTDLGFWILDSEGLATTTLPLNPNLSNITIYMQSVELAFPIPTSFPWESSNLQSVFVVF